MANRVTDVALGAGDRLWQRKTEREIRRDGCGIRATGAVQVKAVNERRGESQFLFAVVENIRGAGGIMEMATLD